MKSISKLKDEARKYEQREEWERAIQAYLQVLRADDGDGDVDLPLFNRVGDLCVRLGRQKEAVGHYEEAADRYAEAGLYNNAIALCNKALRFAPSRHVLLRKLGQFSASQGFITDARRYFLEYAEREFSAGSIDEALTALEDFANLSDDAEVRELLARRLHAHGRSQEAIEEFRRAHAMRVRDGQAQQAEALRNEVRGIAPDVVLDSAVSIDSASAAAHESASPRRPQDLPGLIDVDAPGMAGEPFEIPSGEGAGPLDGFETTPANEPATDESAFFSFEFENFGDEAPGTPADDAGTADAGFEIAAFGSAGAEQDDGSAASADSGGIEGLETMSSDVDPVEGVSAAGDIDFDADDAFGGAGFDLPTLDDPETASTTPPGRTPESDLSAAFETFGSTEFSPPEDEPGSDDIGAFGGMAFDDTFAPGEGPAVDDDLTSVELPTWDDAIGTGAGPADGDITADGLFTWDDAFGSAERPAADDDLTASELPTWQDDPGAAELPAADDHATSELPTWEDEFAAEPPAEGDDRVSDDWPTFDGSAGTGALPPLDFEFTIEDVTTSAGFSIADDVPAPPDRGQDDAREPADSQVPPFYQLPNKDLATGDIPIPEQFAMPEEEESPTEPSTGLRQAEESELVDGADSLGEISADSDLSAVDDAADGDMPAVDDGEARAPAGVPPQEAADSSADRAADATEPAHVTPAEGETSPAQVGAVDTHVPPEQDREYVHLGALVVEEPVGDTRFRVDDSSPTGDEDRDFTELLSRFRAKIAEHVPAEDAAAHYDLGLAFKEMGLVDEAIAEFQIALRDGAMKLKVYEELGHCFLQKDEFNIAEKVLRRALQLKHDDELELLGVYYHLGRAYEALGQRDQARDAYERVLGMDINFQDVSERLLAL
jgi:tetratricopeptide (TPR) repeat protein